MRGDSDIDLDNYQPKSGTLMAQAYNALTQAPRSEYYNIEKTVIAMNALDSIMTKSHESLDDFLLYMAKEVDYTDVASDVLEAKARLIPLVQELQVLEKEYDDFSGWTMFFNSVGAGATRLLSDQQTYSFIGNACMGSVTMNPLVSSSEALAQSAYMTVSAALDSYAAQKEQKDRLSRDLDRVRAAYKDYIYQYMEVYKKHIKEWNELCNLKDRVYLSISNHNWRNAYKQNQEVLKKDPYSREGLLLDGLTLAYIGAINNHPEFNDISVKITDDPSPMSSTSETEPDDSTRVVYPIERSYRKDNRWLQAAERQIAKYDSLYGDTQVAPSELIRGLIELSRGNIEDAEDKFDSSSSHYASQKAELTKMKDLYNARQIFLNQSEAGQELLTMYYSMMYGFDMFSPSLQLASLREAEGKYDMAADLIKEHFRQRLESSEKATNPYYAILTDLDYCEKNLPNSFNLQQLNPSIMELRVDSVFQKKLLSWSGKEHVPDRILITLSNKAQWKQKDVNMIICFKFKTAGKMYETSRHKLDKNVLDPYSSFSSELPLPEGKTMSDITSVRAFVYAENGVCWLETEAQRLDELVANLNKKAMLLNPMAAGNNEFLLSKHLDSQAINQILTYETSVNISTQEKSYLKAMYSGAMAYFSAIYGWDFGSAKQHASEAVEHFKEKRYVTISIPSKLSALQPVFTIFAVDEDKRIVPKQTMESGYIRLDFLLDANSTVEKELPLYMYSNYGNYEAMIKINGMQGSITDSESF